MTTGAVEAGETALGEISHYENDSQVIAYNVSKITCASPAELSAIYVVFFNWMRLFFGFDGDDFVLASCGRLFQSDDGRSTQENC
jgi:hypothetical protein